MSDRARRRSAARRRAGQDPHSPWRTADLRETSTLVDARISGRPVSETGYDRKTTPARRPAFNQAESRAAREDEPPPAPTTEKADPAVGAPAEARVTKIWTKRPTPKGY
jgi:hypothetical protein